jgi:hypothetical protein
MGAGVIPDKILTPVKGRQPFPAVPPVVHSHHPLGYVVPGCIRSHVSWPG